jgi:NAD(P)-dependent dehydrogenase (short-subunit alcohol dehydrogenase family)
MSLNDSFSDRSVLVTGAASGIGRAIAEQCRRAGAYVLLADVVDEVHAVAAQLEADAMVVDVSRSDQVAAAIDHVVERHGSLDFIFNNAGVAIFGDVENLTIEDWDRTIDINLKGVAYGTKLAYDQMILQGGGQIVNTASAAGLFPVPLQTNYVAAKHAVVGIGKTLALESERHGVHVTTFCPGFVDTGMKTNNTLRGTMNVSSAATLVPVRPITPDQAAERLLRGVVKKRALVITPFYVRIVWWIERLSPALSHRLHSRFFSRTVKRARARA